MAEASGLSKTAGRAAALLVTVGVIMFFLGLFGMPRILAIIGVGLMVVSVALFWIEESGQRRLQRRV